VRRRQIGDSIQAGIVGCPNSSVEILGQLGELFLAAVPTVIIVFLFYLFMRWSFFNPMERVLTERHKRAEGARQEAEASKAAVQEKRRAYNESLRKARVEIFTEQEAVRRRVLDERQASISAARAAAQTALQEAKKEIETEITQARAELNQSSGVLADEIAEAIIVGRGAEPVGPVSGETR
jgi:F0F1-type ATP synthase membrane subunit b/b'